MKILITGATGFIGNALIDELHAHTDYHIVALTRPGNAILPSKVKRIIVNSIDESTDYVDYLKEIDVIIHLAARVHKQNSPIRNSYLDYKSINVEGTLNLARQAANSGVQRFIYLSSIKVNGEATQGGHPFEADDPPHPADSYAKSKLEAEIGIREISVSTNMDFVIIRPPLVYGPGVKANFYKLIRLIDRGFPLPFKLLNNHRSFVFIENLTSLVRNCIDHPNAINEVFLVSDDRDISTKELIQMLSKAMGVSTKFFSCPISLLKLASGLLGMGGLIRRLTDNLQVDISKTKSKLDWRPSYSLEEAIKKTVCSQHRL